jgi:hypothetical protein
MENKEVKTNVTNEELMQKVVGLEKELKRANSNIALALTTLTTVYAYEQAKLKQKVKEGTATNTEKEINRLYKYADIVINGAVKQQQNMMLKELKENGELEAFESSSSIIDSIFGF